MSGWLLLTASAALFGAVAVLALADHGAADHTLNLLVVPVAICALAFGVPGGLGASIVALALLGAHEALSAQDLGLVSVATRGAACLIVGALLGVLVGQRRKLDQKLERNLDLSLGLFGTATFDGYFEELNPAWERTLGFTTAELCARPFVEFVHPDDREATERETEKLISGDKILNFRNRYRTADGRYRWLEWIVRPDVPEQKLYASARDVTPQVEAELALKNQSELLEETVRKRTRELEESRLEVLRRLAIAAEYRDEDTYEHTERVGRTAARIAKRLGFSDDDISLIRRAAPLHDIGKVGVPDSVLLKPSSLSPEEFEAMKQHVEIGARILSHGRFPVLHLARTIALAHHERWDGTGYPYGLKGETIPLAGRITAVADVFDALTHARPYKPAWTLKASVAEIESGAGSQFDPRVVEEFMKLDHARLLHPVGGLRPDRRSSNRETDRLRLLSAIP